MRVVRHSDVALFSRVAVPLLVPAEAENNVLLGICAGLQAGWTPPRPPYLATVEDDERVVAVAIVTPPRKLLLSGGPHEALEALCTDLVGSGMSVPGTIGATEVADVFATVWQQRTGDDVRLEHRERIYQSHVRVRNTRLTMRSRASTWPARGRPRTTATRRARP